MFDDVRLPEDVERGAVGGPRFNTTIVEDDAGLEQRNQNWQFSRMRWAVGYNALNAVEFRALLAFFYLRQGRARGFRFKDWSDYATAGSEAVLAGTSTPQPVYINRTDPANIVARLAMWYGDLASYDLVIRPHRYIVLPRVDTLAFYTRGAGGYAATNIPQWDNGNRVVRNGTAAQYYWTGEFDVPVRFDTDELNLDMLHLDSASAPNIPIVELNYENL